MNFEMRPLGRTWLEVTALGLGCATLGGHRIPVSREEAEGHARPAWTAGVRYLDTAPYYGFGQAERCVGDAFARGTARRVGVVDQSRAAAAPSSSGRHPQISTAVHCRVRLQLRRGSCGRSRTVCSGSAWRGVDILYVHDIGAKQHGAKAHSEIMRTFREGGYRALEKLRRSGVVRAIGIGVNEQQVLLEALEWGDWDAFLLAGRYTLLEQAPLDDLLPMPCLGCVDRGRRPAQFRDPGRARHLELQGCSAGGGRSR